MQGKERAIEILAFPRLHVSLIDMSGEGYRVNGGIGFAINSPNIKVTVYSSDSFSVNDSRAFPLSKDGIFRLEQCINNEVLNKKFNKNVFVHINGDLPTNSGFGSGTLIRLACLEGLYLINSVTASKKDLIQASGRGGTSGIGINTYFNGGFVIDIGRKNDKSILLPSNAQEYKNKQPLTIVEGAMPEWEIGICHPNYLKSLTQLQEKEFFNNNTPIEKEEVYSTLYHIIFGLYASIAEDDLSTFSDAIKNIQQCTWKSSEIGIYGNKISEIQRLLYENGATAVGMSSLGPSLYFTATDISDVIEKVESKFKKDFRFYKSGFNNTGRVIRHV